MQENFEEDEAVLYTAYGQLPLHRGAVWGGLGAGRCYLFELLEGLSVFLVSKANEWADILVVKRE